MCVFVCVLITAVDERMKVQLKKYEEEVAAAASVGAGTGDVVAPRCVCVCFINTSSYVHTVHSKCKQPHNRT